VFFFLGIFPSTGKRVRAKKQFGGGQNQEKYAWRRGGVLKGTRRIRTGQGMGATFSKPKGRGLRNGRPGGVEEGGGCGLRVAGVAGVCVGGGKRNEN